MGGVPSSQAGGDLAGFRQAFGRIMPSEVRWSLTAIASDEPVLHIEEAAAVATAVPKRRNEFLAGRRAAREALRQLGLADPGLLPVGPRRNPVWPSGVVGSITHTGPFCMAAVAEARQLGSIGIDLEGDEPLDAELIETVCLQGEIAAARARGEPVDEAAKRLFGLKEAFYKCADPFLRRFLDFSDVETRFVAPDRCRIWLSAAGESMPPVADGRIAAHGGYFLSVVTLPLAQVPHAAKDAAAD